MSREALARQQQEFLRHAVGLENPPGEPDVALLHLRRVLARKQEKRIIRAAPRTARALGEQFHDRLEQWRRVTPGHQRLVGDDLRTGFSRWCLDQLDLSATVHRAAALDVLGRRLIGVLRSPAGLIVLLRLPGFRWVWILRR